MKKITIILMLIAVINIGCIVNILANGYWINKTFCIIAIIMQVIGLIISIISLRKKDNVHKIMIFMMMAILVTTFFIPVEKQIDFPDSGENGLTPTVMPTEIQKNLYKITIQKGE